MTIRSQINRMLAGFWIALAAIVLAALISGCGSNTSVIGPSGTSNGTTLAIADKPPTNPNTALSCPHDAPTELTIVVDEFVAGRGWKVTIDLRRTSVNIPKYTIWYQRVGDTVKSLTLSGTRPITTEYFPVAGVYGFRAQASCDDGLGLLGPVVVKNVGNGSFGADVPPVQPPPPPKPPVDPPKSPCPQTTGGAPPCKVQWV